MQKGNTKLTSGSSITLCGLLARLVRDVFGTLSANRKHYKTHQILPKSTVTLTLYVEKEFLVVNCAIVLTDSINI